MKKLFLLPLTVALVLLTSCSKESYRHGVTLTHPYNGEYVFADQQYDSINFQTFDSYSVTMSNTPWITTNNSLDPASLTIENSYYYCVAARVGLTFQPNTTGTCRYGYVNVRSYGNDWDHTVTGVYYQFPWHNITKPSPTYTYDSNYIPTAATFTLVDSATCVVDTLHFHPYDKWSIDVPSGSFVTPSSVSGSAYNQDVTILLTLNDQFKSDNDTVHLKFNTSNGASTPITVVRKGLNK